jgi:hypothetical protein
VWSSPAFVDTLSAWSVLSDQAGRIGVHHGETNHSPEAVPAGVQAWAVELLSTSGRPLAQIARELGVSTESSASGASRRRSTPTGAHRRVAGRAAMRLAPPSAGTSLRVCPCQQEASVVFDGDMATVHEPYTRVSAPVTSSPPQSAECRIQSGLKGPERTGADKGPSLVMKGSPVRVQASALQGVLAYGGFLTHGRQVKCSR